MHLKIKLYTVNCFSEREVACFTIEKCLSETHFKKLLLIDTYKFKLRDRNVPSNSGWYLRHISLLHLPRNSLIQDILITCDSG